MIESVESIFSSKIFWIFALLCILYLYFKIIVFTYWKRHGIPHDSFTIPFGIFNNDFFMQRTTMGNVVKSSYEKLKKNRFHGLYIFHTRVLMINDPELIKQILVKDFANFCDRGLYDNAEIDPLIGHLFFLSGDKWRTLRAKLSPTFTSGKLKHMFPILNDIAHEMLLVTEENLRKTNIIEMKDLIARYTTDTIFSLAFGLNSQALKYPDSEFRHYGDLTIETNIIRGSLGFFAPKILYALKQPFTDPKVIKFFTELFKDMVDKRRSEKIKRRDFLDSLIDLMDNEQIVDREMENSSKDISAEKIARRLELLEATAQAFVFFIAGFETSSSIATHCLYELALNPQIQENVHKEIDEIQNNSKSFTYETLLQLEYLDMIFLETMRKHPSVPFLNRVCINDYKIPNSNYTIPKDMGLIISVSGLHMDPDIFPEPGKFDPTRFNKENMTTRHPYSYLPFGEGPRICIGKRLGILQSKMALFHLLSNYKFSICEKTPIPNYYSSKSILQTPRDGVYLKVEKRK
ncbi:probable cytochrome P450 6a14 [Phymastichus coffea]|uniref:probable cytochrome P450 6a14 n=1 Tax=Phymastichus coffea TaxID=108790 RepID=UPI00273BAE45|nr:probable cytochrome P450 6a14 [Phymastichus coffea]